MRKRPVLRFLLVLAVSLVGFEVAFHLWIDPSEFFQEYLRLNAGLSASVLQALGDDATATGTLLSSSTFSLEIRRGCDAVQVTGFFLLVMLASPVSVTLWRRLPALAIGAALLLTINLARIVSLYYAGIYFPSAFNAMHVDIWQPAFILLALLLWVAWVRWATRSRRGKTDALA